MSVTVSGKAQAIDSARIAEAFAFTTMSRRLRCTRIYLPTPDGRTATVQIFQSGRIAATAPRTDHAILAATDVLSFLAAPLTEELGVVNVFASGTLGREIDIDKLHLLVSSRSDLAEHRSVLRLWRDNIQMALFRSGRYQLQLKTTDDMRRAQDFLKDFVLRSP